MASDTTMNTPPSHDEAIEATRLACERMQYGGIRKVGIRSIEDFGVCE